MKVEEVRELQGPNAVINARFGFGELPPGVPPVAVRYTSVALLQEYRLVSVKFPPLSLVTVWVSNGVDADPSDDVPIV